MLGNVGLDIAKNLVFLLGLDILQQLQVLCTLETRLERHTELGRIGLPRRHVDRLLLGL
jgi:hypothetical protein